jgi:hypothetical protein
MAIFLMTAFNGKYGFISSMGLLELFNLTSVDIFKFKEK